MKQLLIAVVWVSMGKFLFAQEKAVVLNLKPLAGSVYFLEGGLGNMTVFLGGDEILVVDTKAKEAGDSLEHFMKREFAGKKIRYIINTHNHWDHNGNNARLGKDATIITQRNSIKASETDSQKVGAGRPNVTFNDEMTIYFGGEEIKLIHFPGSHTNHDLVVYFTEAKVLSMGDMYFSGMYPYIASDGDLKGLTAALGKIVTMMPSDVKIVPGHGPVSSSEDLKATHKMLLETSAFVQKQIDAGKSLETIKKEGLGKWTPVWGKGYCKEDCWIETLYNYLKK